MRLPHLAIGERALLRPVADGISQVLLPLGDGFARVHVEDEGILHQGAPHLEDDAADLVIAQFHGHHHGQIPQHRWEARQGVVGGRKLRRGVQRLRVQFESEHALGQLQRLRYARVEFSHMPQHRAVGQKHLGAGPWMPGRGLRGLEAGAHHAQAVQHRLHGALGVIEVHPGIFLRPGPPRAQAPDQPGHAGHLAGRRALALAAFRIPDIGTARLMDGHALHLVPHAAREVLQQPRQQAGAHHGLFHAERIDEYHGCILASQHLQVPRGHERVVHHLVQPRTGECLTQAPLGFGLGRLGGKLRHAAGQTCRDVVVAEHPGDFFEEILLALHVHPRPGHLEGGLRRPVLHPPEPERAEDSAALPFRNGRAQHLLHPGEAQRHAPGGFLAGVHIHAARSHGTSRQLRDELRGPVNGRAHGIEVRPTLEAMRRLGVQPMTLGGAADTGGQEVRGLQHDALRAPGHLAVRAAHHPCNGLSTVPVTNGQIVRIERALLAIQCADLLPRTGTADDDLLPRHLVEIERMQRLAILEVDVVGHVHHVVDGTHATGLQPVLQPLRRGLDGDVLDHPRGIARTTHGILDAHLHLVRRGPSRLGELRLRRTERHARHHPHLPGHPQVRQGVRPVRGDVHLQHHIVQPQRRGDGQPRLQPRRKDEQPRGLLGEPQLLRRAEHPVAVHAPERCLLDLHAIGQLRANGGQGHLVPHLEVLRAAHHLQQLRAPRVHLGHGQLVRVGVLHGLANLGHHHALKGLTRPLHPFDLQPRRGQLARQLFHRWQRHVIAEPLHRNLHSSTLFRTCHWVPWMLWTTAQNCSRKRASFSNIMRRSSMR
ncbi:conserved hypothetical protein [Stigmatella aurantiaca DW4/3-1]|uniref:Uncharacterized protein n=1 Tax=Stigmatella aurantiaca (strain DW4/3-1) TaxID=378806 RepID=Q091S9_STIAD|nr:conserved hypothetical protein [Stigmatella aurantiaca DW4/3-1]